ncbi:MAG: hypothetical protein JNK06_16055 [Candidatus Accumulibacter phosphatis]|uniref:hypothetical protein n=1 Tax=Candidatus Accumulibacter phosphatis TaxID=327160 RepID=UPI001A5A24B2|nr:hypothetical protein [Candidatus Accumulibacter phosphatis]
MHPKRSLLTWPLIAALAGCSAFSPQVVDTRASYGFTKRAAQDPAGSGLYADACSPSDVGHKLECPKFYGLLPAAVDNADAFRLQFLKAFVSDSGAPRLLELTVVPLSLYAMYRGLFFSSEAARLDAARSAMAAAGLYTVTKDNESPTRQQIRLAAAATLNCAIDASVHRYLYTQADIEGDNDVRGRLVATPVTETVIPGWSILVVQQEPAVVPPRGLKPQLQLVADRYTTLLTRLDEVRSKLAETSRSTVVAGTYGNACDSNPNTAFCARRGESKARRVEKLNADYQALESERQRSEDVLDDAGKKRKLAVGLLDRIDRAPFDLVAVVREIEGKVAEAVQRTELGVESVRRALTGLRAAAQDFALPAQEPASIPSPGGLTGTGKTQSGVGKVAGGPARVSKDVADAVEAAASARRLLNEAVQQLRVFLDVDRQRGKSVRALRDCQFAPPGLRLLVAPEAGLTVRAGESVRFSAAGGTDMPSVSLVGATSFKAADVLRLEPDATAGRQSLGVVFTPPANAPDQNVSLVFRNGDLVEPREVRVQASTGAGK